MSLKQKLLIIVSLSFLVVAVIGCEKEGTAEKAGKEADKAFSAAKDKIHEATK
ncbi:MAG: hypothetical protein KAQ71_17600 [Desulfobulbaceae bacterium]|nr:hypothetical protein [Desulfobulbaceae bacterium]